MNEFEIIKPVNLQFVNMLFNRIQYRSPHMHREFELIYNMGSDMICFVESIKMHFATGNFIIMNPNQVHEIVSIGTDPFLICIQIAPEFFENVISNIFNLEFDTFFLMDYKNQKLPELVIQLSHAYLVKENHYEFQCAALIHQIFKELLDEFPHHISTPSEKRSSEEKALRLKRILQYARNHYTEKISLQSLAKEENLSLTYLSRFIKEYLHRSFQEYIGELRFQQAKYLIRNTNRNLMTICEDCGYSDYRYFYQDFLTYTKCTPKQYRISHDADSTSYRSSPDSRENKLTASEALEAIKARLSLY